MIRFDLHGRTGQAASSIVLMLVGVVWIVRLAKMKLWEVLKL
jgi:hypothetical protein